jgi:hypothetical protein
LGLSSLGLQLRLFALSLLFFRLFGLFGGDLGELLLKSLQVPGGQSVLGRLRGVRRGRGAGEIENVPWGTLVAFVLGMAFVNTRGRRHFLLVWLAARKVKVTGISGAKTKDVRCVYL